MEKIWDSYPKELRYYDLAHKEKVKEQNYLLYLQGLYNIRANIVAIDSCLNGRKAKAEYFKEPIQIFPLTEEEKKEKEEKELQKFFAFANSVKKKEEHTQIKVPLTFSV